MKIEFNSAVNFESLKAGEFFIDGCGNFTLKFLKSKKLMQYVLTTYKKAILLYIASLIIVNVGLAKETSES